MALTVELPRSAEEFFALPPSDYILAKSLAASAAESFVIPADAKYVVFSANGDFYANFRTTATVPGDTTDGTASELNPTIRRLSGAGMTGGGGNISVIAPAATIVTASFYK